MDFLYLFLRKIFPCPHPSVFHHLFWVIFCLKCTYIPKYKRDIKNTCYFIKGYLGYHFIKGYLGYHQDQLNISFNMCIMTP